MSFGPFLSNTPRALSHRLYQQAPVLNKDWLGIFTLVEPMSALAYFAFTQPVSALAYFPVATPPAILAGFDASSTP